MTTLILADTHQNIHYIDWVLKKEKGNFDNIIHLGDWFDSFYEPPAVASVRETCEFMLRLDGDYHVTFLVGNHDLSYYEDIFKGDKQFVSNSDVIRKRYRCQGYTQEKSRKIKKFLPKEFVKKCKIAVYKYDFLISHAGFYYPLISGMGRSALLQHMINAWENFPNNYPSERWIFRCGSARGGDCGDIGGPLWLDWYNEFEDGPWPQIVGHTNSPSPRKEGNSYMLDARQNCYAFLSKDGIEIKLLKE